LQLLNNNKFLKIKENILLYFHKKKIINMGIGDWGLGIGDWGFGVWGWGQ